MMKELMNQATLDYIRQHSADDVRLLALQGSRHPAVHLTFALEQIAGRQKARVKLPSWACQDGIIYPPHLAMEQCSSEQTAVYKASISGEGNLLVDLTAGFGVDMAFMSRHFHHAVHVEQQPQLCAISSENYRRLGLSHIEVVCGDGTAYLHTLSQADLIFIDPARRDAHGGRTYGIADCTPNVLEMRDEMLGKARRVIIKLSPMLDWRKAVEDIGSAYVRSVHIVSVENECKELLLVLSKEEGEESSALRVVCVNLLANGQEERFEFDGSSPAVSSVSPLPYCPQYLFEPNASIMKAGCFQQLAQRFTADPVGPNSHLFVSETVREDFPGRRFHIESISSMNRRELKEKLSGITMANITVRNFPMTVQELRRRLKLKEGGDIFIFATTAKNLGHLLFVCRKIS